MEMLAEGGIPWRAARLDPRTYASTFENSEVGDITKLSFELDHEIKCWML
jgi:hypothetical protein